ncbi:MAG: hypothetical protein GF309_03635 [Candidatus Lokiarchaeota archaeon]|nr:hypothetical protein [Candidatus Lokiarchaeota archaeon]
MYKLVALINDILGVLLSKGAGRLESAGDVYIFQMDNHVLRIPGKMLASEIKKQKIGHYYSRKKSMHPNEILDTIDAILNDCMFSEFMGINGRIEKVRESLCRPSNPDAFHENPPGKVHIRFRRDGTKYLLVSECPANTESYHELPLFHKLERRWLEGKLLQSFSLLREDEYGWHHEFEIDAVSIAEDIVYLFEMKHSKCPVAAELLKTHLKAARFIRAWHRKLQKKLTHFCPILYMRERNGEPSPHINHIYYEELPERFSPLELHEFTTYDLQNPMQQSHPYS